MQQTEYEKQLQSYRQCLYKRRKNQNMAKELLNRVNQYLGHAEGTTPRAQVLFEESLEDVMHDVERMLTSLQNNVRRGTEFNFNQLILRFRQQFKGVAQQLARILKRTDQLEQLIGNDTNFVSLLYSRLSHYKERTNIYFKLYEEVRAQLETSRAEVKRLKEENQALEARCKCLGHMVKSTATPSKTLDTQRNRALLPRPKRLRTFSFEGSFFMSQVPTPKRNSVAGGRAIGKLHLPTVNSSGL